MAGWTTPAGRRGQGSPPLFREAPSDRATDTTTGSRDDAYHGADSADEALTRPSIGLTNSIITEARRNCASWSAVSNASRTRTVHRRSDLRPRCPGSSADQSMPRCGGLRLARSLRGAPGDGPGGGRACIHRPRHAAQTLRTLRRMPGVVLMHGAGGSQCGLSWPPRHLAGHGYATLVLTHQGNLVGHERLSTGVRWLRSRSNPFRDLTLRNRIGLAGHSEGSLDDARSGRARCLQTGRARFAEALRARGSPPRRSAAPTAPQLRCAAARPRSALRWTGREPTARALIVPALQEDRPQTLEVRRPVHYDPGHARLRA